LFLIEYISIIIAGEKDSKNTAVNKGMIFHVNLMV
jgi:hypothetical protein